MWGVHKLLGIHTGSLGHIPAAQQTIQRVKAAVLCLNLHVSPRATLSVTWYEVIHKLCDIHAGGLSDVPDILRCIWLCRCHSSKSSAASREGYSQAVWPTCRTAEGLGDAPKNGSSAGCPRAASAGWTGHSA